MPETIDLRDLMDKHPEMFRATYKRVAWGYVPDGEDILVAERCKADDPKRYGELVIPGGGLEENESYAAAALRETKEESGVVGKLKLTSSCPISQMWSRNLLRENDKVVGINDTEGYLWFMYNYSEKRYVGQMFHLHVKGDKTLREPKDEDTTRPRWMPRNEVYENREKFTPVCQILLDIINEHENKEKVYVGILIDSEENMFRHLTKDGNKP